ncbi:hypothetical protein [Kribbella endophytica]
MSELARDEFGVIGATKAANAVREQVVRTLEAYVGLSARMRRLEDAFRTQVMGAGYQLQQLIEERRRLEAELDRIRTRLADGEYADDAALAADVDAALVDTVPGPLNEDDPTASAEQHSDDGLDELSRRRILREFKRIVLPKVHTDTSTAPPEEFEVAHAVYRERDYVLMEAFVLQYRGELGPYDDDGAELSTGQATDRLASYRAAARRLDDRLARLRADATEAELTVPDDAQHRIREQNQEFLRAIDEESATVMRLRTELENLRRKGDQP